MVEGFLDLPQRHISGVRQLELGVGTLAVERLDGAQQRDGWCDLTQDSSAPQQPRAAQRMKLGRERSGANRLAEIHPPRTDPTDLLLDDPLQPLARRTICVSLE